MISVYFTRYSSLENAKQSILEKYSKEYALCYEPSGAPILLSHTAPKRYVSISHTDKVLVMAFSESRVGIDIERADRKVSPKVCESIEKWTRIEAYAKWTGKGLDKGVINGQLPEEKISTRYLDDYVISVCGDGQDFELWVDNKSL